MLTRLVTVPLLTASLLLAACQPKGDDTGVVDTSGCDFSQDPCASGQAWITTCEVYPMIQDALDAASNGTTVHVCAGTHTEVLTVAHHGDQHLNLDGEGSGTTFLDAHGEAPGIEVGENVDLDIAGLTIQGAVGVGSGGGIVVNSARLVLSDVVISDNAAATAAAIHATDSDLRFTSGAVLRNTSASGTAVLLSNSTLQSITSDWGDGPTDNSGGDIAYDGAQTYDFGADASFTCSPDTTACVAD